ncbi:MAG: 4Fe-4S dicluster domain-containing protein [Planctomycetales bacterium]|nr:4Fe-4S dicluster domain-containing protein [Planctomycetales bacterium]
MTKSTAQRQTPRQAISRRDFVLGRVWSWLRDTPVNKPDVESVLQSRQPKAVLESWPLSEKADSDSFRSRATTFVNSSSHARTRHRSIPVMRPPGAIAERGFLAGCTRCEACIDACPHDAIIHAPVRLREAAGTPTIDADHQPCLMCADFPCISACEPGVLTSAIPVMMGTARVVEHLCLPYQGAPCTACSESCPVENAIVMTEEADGNSSCTPASMKPTVNESICTGCGVCRSVCPAPENAILLMPMFSRPLPLPAEEKKSD